MKEGRSMVSEITRRTAVEQALIGNPGFFVSPDQAWNAGIL
jgi:hypothetical protein